MCLATVTVVTVAIGLLALSALPAGVRAETTGPPDPTSEPRLAPPVFAERGMLTPCYTGCGGEFAPIVNAGYEQEVVELVNDVRADNDLPPLNKSGDVYSRGGFHAARLCPSSNPLHRGEVASKARSLPAWGRAGVGANAWEPGPLGPKKLRRYW